MPEQILTITQEFVFIELPEGCYIKNRNLNVTTEIEKAMKWNCEDISQRKQFQRILKRTKEAYNHSQIKIGKQTIITIFKGEFETDKHDSFKATGLLCKAFSFS